MSVEYRREGRIAIITLNRPEKLNAISPEMYEEISARLQEIDRDPEVWVGIVTGAGRAFSAGADLLTMHDPNLQGPGWRPIRPDRFDQGLAVQKPLIAAVNGYCLAGGLELALFCDIRIAAEDAQFGCPEVRWNLLHGYGAMRLPQLIGLSQTLYLLLTGEFIDAREAHRIGLVHEVVPKERLMERALALAGRICQNAPLAVRMSKELALRSSEMSLTAGVQLYQEFVRILNNTEDGREGDRAFRERRPPEYKAR
ncbi:putative enoyl-CoA hydratase echA8 [bacterium HR25]|nr:putative enoyl-CoA hydratase echA8 [bacterium HR25]